MRPEHRVRAAALAIAFAVSGSFATAAAAPDVPANCAINLIARGDGDTADMTFVPAGTFTMGSNRHRPEERYTHIVSVDGFWIDRTEVTNAQFAKFVAATGYVTLAERGGDAKVHANMPAELLVPGSVAFIMPTDTSRGGSITQWFQYIAGADWRHPEGVGQLDCRSREPPGGSRRLRGRAGLRRLAGAQPPDRGAMGIRSARRARGRG